MSLHMPFEDPNSLVFINYSVFILLEQKNPVCIYEFLVRWDI